eukprot:365595-Chlamydomonas_euryale.AAC.13
MTRWTCGRGRATARPSAGALPCRVWRAAMLARCSPLLTDWSATHAAAPLSPCSHIRCPHLQLVPVLVLPHPLPTPPACPCPRAPTPVAHTSRLPLSSCTHTRCPHLPLVPVFVLPHPLPTPLACPGGPHWHHCVVPQARHQEL